MLTRSRKKRDVGKDKSYSQNSNQNYSTVPGNDAVEVGEMVTMDHGGTSGGLDDDCQRTDYLQVARLSQEKLNDLVDDDKGEFPGLRLGSLLDMAASRNIVSVDPKMLNPVLWRTLPKELLLLVLARLPFREIIRLRMLSREWRRDMTTVNSDINQACDEASPIMVTGFSYEAFLSEGILCSEFLVTICDLNSHKSQYSYRALSGNSINGPYMDMGACDGGLVCFVSTSRPSKANPLRIVVVNLLTRLQRKLPPLKYVYSTPPKMMHIEVDSQTMCYRVVVVGKNIKGRPTVEIYDSGARQWTKATPPLGVIFGVAYNWEYNKDNKTFISTSTTQSVYDFARRQLKHCEKEPRGASWMTFWKDCLFVLHENTSNGGIVWARNYSITKYRIENNAKDLVQERSYLCSPFEDLIDEEYLSSWTLKACEGFLMVFLFNFDSYRHFWLLDLATGKWNSLPHCFRREEDNFLPDFLMSRAFWNVIP